MRRAAAAAALALALAAAPAVGRCVDGARIASIGLRGDAILLLDAQERPFAVVSLWPGDGAALSAARRLEPIRGRICDNGMLLLADGRVVLARRVLVL